LPPDLFKVLHLNRSGRKAFTVRYSGFRLSSADGIGR